MKDNHALVFAGMVLAFFLLLFSLAGCNTTPAQQPVFLPPPPPTPAQSELAALEETIGKLRKERDALKTAQLKALKAAGSAQRHSNRSVDKLQAIRGLWQSAVIQHVDMKQDACKRFDELVTDIPLTTEELIQKARRRINR